MKELPLTHSACYEQVFTTGHWTVKRSTHPFSAIAGDLTIEQTVNRDTKTAGGLRGITLNRGNTSILARAPPTPPLLPLTSVLVILGKHLNNSYEAYIFICIKIYLKGAVKRWVLAQPDRAAVTRQCEMMAGLSDEQRQPKDADPTRMKADEIAINNILSTIKAMVNPFADSDELVCISTGFVATEEVAHDLLTGIVISWYICT